MLQIFKRLAFLPQLLQLRMELLANLMLLLAMRVISRAREITLISQAEIHTPSLILDFTRIAYQDQLTFDTRHLTLVSTRVLVVPQKPTRSAPEKNENELGNFTRLLDRLLKVPHSKIKAELEAEKKRTKAPRDRARRNHAFRDVTAED